MNVKSAIANFQLLVIYYAKELKNTLMLLCSTSAKNVGNNFHEKTIVIGMSQEKNQQWINISYNACCSSITAQVNV